MEYEYNPSIYEVITLNIKKYRLKKNMSIKTLSSRTKIKESYLINLDNINNTYKISIYDLYKISVVLNVSINKFFEK